MPAPSFAVVPGHAASPVVLHVPHAARTVPAAARASIVLDDVALEAELDAMTDAHTDELAALAARATATRPWRFVNGLSRLVVDPERFPDDREEMRAVGMGAVYTATSSGAVLREPDPPRDADLVARWFDPYARALADLVDQRLAATGRCVLLDLHSYPTDALPYELHAADRRPAVCLGTDEQHTPAWLRTAAREAFADVGDVVLDEPFSGTYVPLRHWGRDERVVSLMVELRRDVYLDDRGGLADASADVVAALAGLVDRVSEPTR